MGGHDMELSHYLSSLPHHQGIVKIYVPIMYCKQSERSDIDNGVALCNCSERHAAMFTALL